jgi:hypothetical protein
MTTYVNVYRSAEEDSGSRSGSKTSQVWETCEVCGEVWEFRPFE